LPGPENEKSFIDSHLFRLIDCFIDPRIQVPNETFLFEFNISWRNALGRGLTVVAQHIRNLRGGSQPNLVQASDGLLYVAKFTNNLQGPNLPFNESMGSEIYKACGLAGPKWRPLLVTDTFLDQNPDCWMQTPEGSLRPSSGLCFGSRYLGGEGVRMLEILPGTSFKRVRNHTSFWLAWLIDICAGHCDNRQALFLEDSKGWLDAYFVDHGHLFGGPKGEMRLNFQASRYLDARIYQRVTSQQLLRFQKIVESLDTDLLWKRIQTLPDDWKTKSALDAFALCLGTLSTPNLLQNIVETVDATLRRSYVCERANRQIRTKPPASVLRPGLQGAGQEHGRSGKINARVACA
jgi:hypothetical protein